MYAGALEVMRMKKEWWVVQSRKGEGSWNNFVKGAFGG